VTVALTDSLYRHRNPVRSKLLLKAGDLSTRPASKDWRLTIDKVHRVSQRQVSHLREGSNELRSLMAEGHQPQPPMSKSFEKRVADVRREIRAAVEFLPVAAVLTVERRRIR
jgi:hypothetical protein